MRLNYLKTFIFLFVGLQTVSAQEDFSTNWTGYFSFYDVKDVVYGDDKVWGAALNAVYSFDLTTQEIDTYTTIDGLSGNNITVIHFSEEFQLLVIGYEDGLIEIVRLSDDRIFKVVDILEKPTIEANKKRINHFNEFQGRLFIATDFGLSEYSLQNLEFNDTYIYALNGEQAITSQSTIVNGEIWVTALENKGIYKADVNNPNLVDFQNWTRLTGGTWYGVTNFNDTPYLLRSNRNVHKWDGTTFPVVHALSGGVPLELTATDDYLLASYTDRVQIIDANDNLLPAIFNLPDLPNAYRSGIALGNTVYAGTEEFGILEYDITTATQIGTIVEPGPLNSNIFGITVGPDQVWTVFGAYTVSYNPFPLDRRGASKLTPDGWVNFSFEELFSAIDLVEVEINPDNPNLVHISSFLSGIVEIEDDVPIILYDKTNSGLESRLPGSIDHRVNGLQYDDNGDMWVLTSRIDNALKIRHPDGSWDSIDISPAIANTLTRSNLREVIIDPQGNPIFASNREGVIAYDKSTGLFHSLKEGIGVGDLPINDIRSIAIDDRGQLWVGTRLGLRILFNVASIYDDDTPDTQSIIVLDENGIPQELLSDGVISDIKIDGNNNKWIATGSSGAFLVSPNGQETLQHFTKDNSPLPSNNVQQIEIDPDNGVVYFGTPGGMLAFQGEITTKPSDDLGEIIAFPNPIKPGYEGDLVINGLTDRARVKITDTAGNLVYEEVSNGGTVTWDTRAFGKHKVASGVYLLLISNDDGSETTVSKVAIIR